MVLDHVYVFFIDSYKCTLHNGSGYDCLTIIPFLLTKLDNENGCTIWVFYVE